MTINKIKLFAIIFFAIPLIAIMIFKTAPATAAATSAGDPAAEYKAKCAACHTPTASKFYDPTKSDAEHIETIMKGKKGEKPPFMPGFEAKGMTADEAKGMAEYMKTLKPAAN